MKTTKAKLAIALQVFDGDAQMGRKLAKLICDIEPERRADIEFIISARRGTNPHTVRDIIAIAQQKFENVQAIQGKRFGTGWPNGCNDLWAETMMRASQFAKAKLLTATGILTFESDCIPMRPDWLDIAASEWERCEKAGKEVVGHAHIWPDLDSEEGQEDPKPTHINGNAIFHRDITKNHTALNGSSPTAGWDAYHGDLLLSIGLDTPFIYQKYRMKNVTREDVEYLRKGGEIPALFHGIKTEDGINAIRAMMKDETFYSRINGTVEA